MEEEKEYSINKSYDTDICNSTNSLDSKVLSAESQRIRIEVIKPKRRVIIEPMLMMYYLFASPLSQVSQLFVYGRMEEIVAHRTGFNMSLLDEHSKNHSTNPCQEAINKSTIQYNFTQAAQEENAHYSMITRLVYTAPSLMAMVILGSYSDKGGRRVAIVPFMVAEFFSTVVFFIVLYFKLSIWILQINNVIIGLSGGGSLMMVGCYSYIADITSKEERLFRFTLLVILEEMISIVGPIGFGYWIKKQGYIWPVVFSLTGRFIIVIYVVFFIPETVKKDENAKFFTFSHMKCSARVFLKNDKSNLMWKLCTLLFVFIVYCIGAGVSTPLSLFELNTPLCWDSVTLGYYKTVGTAAVAFGGVCSTKGLKLIASDEAISIIASVAHACLYIYRTFVKNTLMMFLCECHLNLLKKE